ncbi:MAG TPA: hypothetical protein VFV80_04475 [Geminicoccaceae bacterium]|nr:hypothetical protein [Geminicoccaceae bacterium]
MRRDSLVNAMRGVIAAALTGLVVACGSSYETFRPPPLDFSDRPPLRLAVGRVTVESAYRPRDTAPYVDNVMPLKPEDAIRRMLEARLVAAGGPGSMQAVILEASVKEQELATQGGLRGFFTTEAAAKLEGRFQVQVDRLSPSGEVLKSVSTAVTRTSAVPEGVGYAERQRIGYELVRDLVDDLDAGLTANARANFADILVP